ncbi:MAG: tRNA (guanosine(46)-N7)-methyltransferase TrmB [Aquificae bacterium]|nr:tRNA (guanosine(46)-N7)-methyltransferase TrmB [Aquificota bacterium]
MLCYLNYKRVKKPLEVKDPWVEVGFGRGDFIVKLAKEHPEKTLIGFEISHLSVEKLLKRVKREGLKNVLCSRIDAYWGFYLLFRDGSVERVFMNYPDPWFKKRHHRRRLTTPERLYVFAKKLKTGGEIKIRSDEKAFLDFTLESAEQLGCFAYELERLSVSEPLTKYEQKWLSMGRELYQLTLKKVKEPPFVEHPQIKEVEQLFPVKVKKGPVEQLENRTEKLADKVYLKTFKLWRGKEGYLLEALLSEEGYLQKFLISIRDKGEEFVVDVSPFSEVLKTENLQRAVERVARLIEG